MQVHTEEHPHARVARQLWMALSHGDADAVCELLSEDVIWRAFGRNPLSGEFKGHADVLDHIARSGELVEDLRSELREIYTSRRGAILHYSILANRGPRILELDYLLMLGVRGGRIVRVHSVPMDQHGNDAFWCWMQ